MMMMGMEEEEGRLLLLRHLSPHILPMSISQDFQSQSNSFLREEKGVPYA